MSTAGPPSAPAPTVVLGVSGSIAAFKAVEVARHFVRAGVRVLPAMTAAARQFVGPATLAGLTGERVAGDMFEPGLAGEIHVALARAADVVVLCPATADLLADLAAGHATDVVRAVALCTSRPIVVAPAMHPAMWAHPATQRNVRTLLADGRCRFVGPVEGEVASGETGLGRMAEPLDVADVVLGLLRQGARRDLEGVRLLVTAGPTVEDLDPVRFLSNRSSGTMGFAVAECAALRGARVTLVAGPVGLPTPTGVTRHDVRSALELDAVLGALLGADLSGADALVMVAAVADYRPAERAAQKLKRSGAPLTLTLEPNPDILAGLGAVRRGGRPLLVGFALETASGPELEAIARAKLAHKRVDLVVANGVATLEQPESSDVVLVDEAASVPLGRLGKRDLADRILDWVAVRCRS
ncbi:MAG: bifunctional phosphopantothenoylcysteine decarboxylase/phosphopantothenate--cysteine ligase CoaBC [Myxococcales bacterium]|nr:bifunctional phosphopantothenoylcysteine decarboxylase/phosphopantothenate--cysteine ligase CoaBC [Myxococcales bacterium]